MLSRVALFAVLLTPFAAMTSHAADDKDKGGWTRCKHAKYKAKQVGDQIVLVAFGTHPTSGYKAKFKKLPIRIYPPQFEFLEQKPTGITLQVLTPFAEITSFKASGKVKAVIVHDGNGKHTVKVEPAKTP
jgi:hypothetical protein